MRKHTPKQIGYYDMFSGPGIYKDGKLSTPILIGKQCEEDPILKNLVWMIFNDVEFKSELEKNFKAFFPSETFFKEPLFGDKVFGEFDQIDRFLTRPTYENGMNECPAILFIDPWGYKHINTSILIKFLEGWGNEVFIFINTKRLNADIEKEVSQNNLRRIFPTTYEKLKAINRHQSTVEQRHKFIVDCIADEFKNVYKNIYCTAFEFMEEDQSTTSHFLLHITKGPKGFELIKTVYNKFANIHRAFNSPYITYTFDPKKLSRAEMFDEMFKQDKIDFLKEQLLKTYGGKKLSSIKLYKDHQVNSMYAAQHYRLALRQLADDGLISVEYTDGKNHKVSVLLNEYCILSFK